MGQSARVGRGSLYLGDLGAPLGIIPIPRLLLVFVVFSRSLSFSSFLTTNDSPGKWKRNPPSLRQMGAWQEILGRKGNRKCAGWSAGKLRCRPRGRGCNIPELPVESALDQVHSQPGPPRRQPAPLKVAPGPFGLALVGHSCPSSTTDTVVLTPHSGLPSRVGTAKLCHPLQKHPSLGQPILRAPLPASAAPSGSRE